MSKITFHFTDSVKKKLTSALYKYGDYEVGGILIGRKVLEDTFEIIDASISDENNVLSFASFIRETKKSEQLLKEHFLNSTGYYIGEWHSHPKFSLDPSSTDIKTMLGILSNPSYGVSFVVLFILHISQDELRHKGFFFHKELDEVIALE